MKRLNALLKDTYRSCVRHNQLTNAAALSFFFLLSLSPLLIFLVSLLALVPAPNLDRHIVEALSQIVPGEAMRILDHLLSSVFESNRHLLSLGILGAIWAGSTGFNAMIMAFNSAYLVKEGRPLWKRQVVSIVLTVVVGAMMIAALLLLFLGAQVGSWLVGRVGMDSGLERGWPYIRWVVVVGFTMLSIEVLYFIAPNVKHKFLAQIPGSAVAVLLWLFSSFALGLYLQRFAGSTTIYGTLGAMIALMLWFYFTSLAILIGAEVNAQMQLKSSEDRTA